MGWLRCERRYVGVGHETSRIPRGSKPVHQIMVDNHVSAFFHGHDHEYAYEKRDGVVYQCLPAAGFSGYGFNSYSLGAYTLEVLPSPGHLRVTVTPAQATWIMSRLPAGRLTTLTPMRPAPATTRRWQQAILTPLTKTLP